MNKPTNDGGPAFPAHDWLAVGNTHPGMSLRDWFAGMALQGILANPNSYLSDGAWRDEENSAAEAAYDIADDMIKVRSAS